MANWAIDEQRAKRAAQEMADSAGQVKRLLNDYAAAKQELLQYWEGSQRDDYVQRTGTAFETSCEEMRQVLQKLAEEVLTNLNEHVKSDILGSEIVNGSK